MPLISIEEPRPARPAPEFALFALGFRPFYLLAAGFAALAIPLWVLVLRGTLAAPLPGALWHAHEMLFGFAVAVIIGFLYTAGRNWTGLPTPQGATLAGLAALWLAGRLAMWFGPQAAPALSVVATVVDVSFLPLAAGFLAHVLIKAGSRRNYFIPMMLMVLALTNVAFHLAVRGVLGFDPLQALWFALGLITLLETIIGGRVIPMFTANALRGVTQWQHPRLNQAAIAMTGLALMSWVFVGGTLAALTALLACLLQLARCIGWNPWATRSQPLLWSLHLAHAWLPLGLLLLALAQFGLVPRSAAVHAFAIGATGGLIIAMITRTALGHLGRPLRASGHETAMYAGVQLAAWVRVLGMLLVPGATLLLAEIASTLWALAFALYVLRYAGWLARPRPDGRPG